MRIRDTINLLREFAGFARTHRAYWIVPLIVMLGIAGFLAVAGQAAIPLLYTLF